MKNIVIFILWVLTSLTASAEEPVCTNVGWGKPDGWKLSNGKIVQDDTCRDKVLLCMNEGWIAYKTQSEKFLGWDSQCAAKDKPKCINQGMRSEGWMMTNGKFFWANCHDQVVVCTGKGSRSQGWTAFELNLSSALVVSTNNCKK